jgi:hypothetical protein
MKRHHYDLTWTGRVYGEPITIPRLALRNLFFEIVGLTMIGVRQCSVKRSKGA